LGVLNGIKNRPEANAPPSGSNESILRMFDREDRTISMVHDFFGHAPYEHMC
jgi:hypothetical protein